MSYCLLIIFLLLTSDKHSEPKATLHTFKNQAKHTLRVSHDPRIHAILKTWKQAQQSTHAVKIEAELLEEDFTFDTQKIFQFKFDYLTRSDFDEYGLMSQIESSPHKTHFEYLLANNRLNIIEHHKQEFSDSIASDFSSIIYHTKLPILFPLSSMDDVQDLYELEIIQEDNDFYYLKVIPKKITYRETILIFRSSFPNWEYLGLKLAKRDSQNIPQHFPHKLYVMSSGMHSYKTYSYSKYQLNPDLKPDYFISQKQQYSKHQLNHIHKP